MTAGELTAVGSALSVVLTGVGALIGQRVALRKAAVEAPKAIADAATQVVALLRAQLDAQQLEIVGIRNDLAQERVRCDRLERDLRTYLDAQQGDGK